MTWKIKTWLIDILLWGSIPLWGILSYGESKLTVTESEHKLLQVLLVLLLFIWVSIFYKMGEKTRVAHYTPHWANRTNNRNTIPEIEVHHINVLPAEDYAYQVTENSIMLEMEETTNVENH